MVLHPIIIIIILRIFWLHKVMYCNILYVCTYSNNLTLKELSENMMTLQYNYSNKQKYLTHIYCTFSNNCSFLLVKAVSSSLGFYVQLRDSKLNLFSIIDANTKYCFLEFWKKATQWAFDSIIMPNIENNSFK